MNLSGEMDINQLDKKISTAILNSANLAIPRSKEKIGRESNFGKPIVEVLKARNFWGKKYREFRDKFTATKYAELEKLANELILTYRIEQWNKFLESQGPHPLSSVLFDYGRTSGTKNRNNNHRW